MIRRVSFCRPCESYRQIKIGRSINSRSLSLSPESKMTLLSLHLRKIELASLFYIILLLIGKEPDYRYAPCMHARANSCSNKLLEATSRTTLS